MAENSETPMEPETVMSTIEEIIIYDVDERCVGTMMDYMSGKMSFEEYTNILEQGIKEEPPDEILTDDTLNAFTSSSQTRIAVEEDGSGNIRKKGPKVRRKLPKHLQGLVGEANAKFAMSELDEAERMCLEVIRSAPNFPQPFQTLAMIYEEKQDMEKCLQFMLIAAYLSKTDADEWRRVGDLYLENNDTHQAALCYEKACKIEPGNVESVHLLCDLLKRLGEDRKCLECYQRLLVHMKSSESSQGYMRIARDVVREWHDLKENERAMSVMDIVFKRRPESIEMEDINVLLELYLGKAMYERALLTLIKHCNVSLFYQSISELSASNVTSSLPAGKPWSCHIDGIMPIDLSAKLIVCLVHLQFYECIKDVAHPVQDENPEVIGDLLIDIAEAYMAGGRYSAARPILSRLVKTVNFSKAAVWLRYAECLNSLQEIPEAIKAFDQVVQMAPSHYQARLTLSALHQQTGNAREALRVLRLSDVLESCDSATNHDENLRLVVARCNLLHAHGLLREFADCAQSVLYASCRSVIEDERYRSADFDHKRCRNRLQAIVYFDNVSLNINDLGLHVSRSSITTDELWALYVRLCAALLSLKSYNELQNITILALMCPQFGNNPERSAECEFMCIASSLLSRSSNFAYMFIRDLCLRHVDNTRVWNLFNQVVTVSQDLRHNRFCIRLAMKFPHNLALGILNGNNAMVSGSYKHALGEYVAALRHNTDDPLINLLVGLCFIHMASQKFVQKHHSLTIQATAFLDRYLELRGACQESYYNVGRAFHQLGLCHFAANYYKKALTLPPVIPGDERFDLTREVAFNLVLIYKASKSYRLAQQVIQRYLVV